MIVIYGAKGQMCFLWMTLFPEFEGWKMADVLRNFFKVQTILLHWNEQDKNVAVYVNLTPNL